ncbi:hypothetical protein GOP47_0020285 [Adiantum capillus-veneris]|uniref:ATP synthase subunit epsilon, mitochondrial n=1 Tax=Adiantum capillus-veneris TaxID=13818 RepID=A0A9D4Z9B2_ADICA|nr:hypothetical protein GOP47_0020285 [Adiantum capillus-veneris]
MSAAVANQASGPFWRAAGMTYVAYVNTCSSLVRKCLKEPHKSEAATREQVFYKVSMWEEGIPQKSDIREITVSAATSSTAAAAEPKS